MVPLLFFDIPHIFGEVVVSGLDCTPVDWIVKIRKILSFRLLMVGLATGASKNQIYNTEQLVRGKKSRVRIKTNENISED